jgi:hypothetical protein
MKKLFLIIILGLFVNGCASTETKVNKNKLNIGINKEDFCFVQVTMCIQTMGEAWNNKIRGIYYPDTKKEIAYDKNEKTFFVFENVNQGINYREYDDNGDGTLIKIFKNLGEAKKFASKKEVILNEDKLQNAKKACKELGFIAGTEEFAECSLKKLKE